MKELYEIRSEEKSLYGYDYIMTLVSDRQDAIEGDFDEIDEHKWWVLKPSPKCEKLANWTARNFLNLTSENMRDKRMQDKYNSCEAGAVQHINWAMDSYFVHTLKFIGRELKYLIYVLWKTTKHRIKYKFNKLFTKNYA